MGGVCVGGGVFVEKRNLDGEGGVYAGGKSLDGG